MPEGMRDLAVENRLGDGPVAYDVGLAWQRELVALRQSGAIPDTLLLLEHAPVVTHGKLADPTNRVVNDSEWQSAGIALHPTDRGGDHTYHGPGQLTGYPIVHLGEGSRDIHRYVRSLEEVLIRAARELGVAAADRSDFHAGVWVTDRYLAAIGVKVSRWVTHHGFALNVDSRVQDGFRTIVACGVKGKRITSLSEEVGWEIPVSTTAECVARHFCDVGNYRATDPVRQLEIPT